MCSREKYKEMAKKFKLPKLEDLEKVFAFKLSKDSENIFYDIMKGIEETLIYSRKLLESLIFINEGSSPGHIYESRFIKKDIFKSYKKLMEIRWKYINLYFHTTEKKCAEFIKTSYDDWNGEIKENILELSKDMENAWKNYKGKKQENQNYFG